MTAIRFIMLAAALWAVIPGVSEAAQGGGHGSVLSGKLVIEGTDDGRELLRGIARRFEDLHPGTEVEVSDGIGSEGGIKAVIDERAQIARVSGDAWKKQRGMEGKVFAVSPVVFATHPVVRLDGLSSEQIAGIYSGRVADWQDLGGTALRIYPLGRESADPGRLAIVKQIPEFRIKAPAGKTYYSASLMVEAISMHPGAIGYAPMADAAGADVKVLKVDGVYPLALNVRNGSYVPAVPLVLAYRGGLGNPLARAFLDFLGGPEARRIIVRHGCVPPDKSKKEK